MLFPRSLSLFNGLLLFFLPSWRRGIRHPLRYWETIEKRLFMQSFRVRDSGSWPSAMRASGKGLSLKEFFCCYCSLQKACYFHAHYHSSTDYYCSSCPHGGEASAIPHAIGRQSKIVFFMQSFRVRDSGSWPSAMRASGKGLSLKEFLCCYCLQE